MSEQLALTLEPDSHRRFHLCPADRELITRAIRCLEERYLVQKDVLTSPEATRDFLKLRLDGIAYEVFAPILLDNRQQCPAACRAVSWHARWRQRSPPRSPCAA